MRNFSQKQKITFGVIIAIIFLATIGFTYAYFTAGIAEQNPNNQVVTTGSLSLNYVDGKEISMDRAFPGDSINKTFHVTNTGTLDVFYKIDWESYHNEIQNEELVLSLNCKSYSDYYGEDDNRNVEEGTCDSLLSNPLYTSESPDALLENIYITPGYTHEYELTVTFTETSSEQNYNQGKLFNGVINILESSEAVTLRGILTDTNNNPISGATIVVHSRESRGVTDENGIYEIQKVEVGSHEIEVFNSENTLIAEDSITIESSQNSNITNKTIAWKNNTSSEYLKIDVNTSTNAVTNYDIVSQIEVTYNTNGGDTLSPNTKTVSFNNTYGTLPEPTKTGSTFTSWSLEQAGGYPVDEDTTVTTPADHTLYAQWNLNQYVVYFNANTGSVNPESKTVTYSLEYGDLPVAEKEHYDFIGWFTEANGGTQVNSTDIVNITSNQTLYAHYQIKSYTLNLVKGTGVSSITATGCTTVTTGSIYSCAYGTSVTVTAVAANDYIINNTLSGTNIESKQNGVAFNMPVPTSGNSVTLTATASIDMRLKAVMLRRETSYADNVSSPYVTASTGINFGEVSSDTNGKGLYYTTDASKTENGTRVYYYRGAVENNYVIFSGFCWRIVRTVEDGSVRLVYGGTPTSGVCPQTGTDVKITRAAYNPTYMDNAYVGYMMGIDNQCAGNTSCEGTIKTTSKQGAQTNTYSSNIKKVIDAWYIGGTTSNKECTNDGTTFANCNFSSLGTNKLSSNSSLIVDTPYCNDRSITDATYNLGYGTNMTYYAAYTRLIKTPTYKCAQNNDKFTVSGTLGNGALTNPIGMLTADEVAYAGGKQGSTNNTYYLYTIDWFWTMSASDFDGGHAYVFNLDSDGYLDNYYGVHRRSLGVRPAVSLRSIATVSEGTGAYNDPYIIE